MHRKINAVLAFAVMLVFLAAAVMWGAYKGWAGERRQVERPRLVIGRDGVAQPVDSRVHVALGHQVDRACHKERVVVDAG